VHVPGHNIARGVVHPQQIGVAVAVEIDLGAIALNGPGTGVDILGEIGGIVISEGIRTLPTGEGEAHKADRDIDREVVVISERGASGATNGALAVGKEGGGA